MNITRDNTYLNKTSQSQVVSTSLKYYLVLLFLFAACWFVSSVPAQAKTLGSDLSYAFLEDPGGQISLSDVANTPDNQLNIMRSPLTLGYVDHPVWVKLTIPAEAFVEPTMWFVLRPPYLDYVTLHTRVSGQNSAFVLQQAGDLTPVSQRPIQHRFIIFPLQQPTSGQALDVIIRLQSTSTLILSGNLKTPAEVLGSSLKSDFFWGGYYSVGILSILLALAIGLLTKNRILIVFAACFPAYMISAGVQGYLSLFAPDSLVNVANQALGVSMLLAYASLLWLGRQMLEIRQLSPRFDQFVHALSWLAVVATLSVPLGQYGLAIQILTPIFEAVRLIMSGMAIFHSRHRNITYRLFTASYTLHALGAAMAIAVIIGVIPAYPVFYEIWQYTLVLAMLVIVGTILVTLKTQRQQNFSQRQFIGMLAHEYRTPLAVIEVTARNLASSPPKEANERNERIERIIRNTRQLGRLVDLCLTDAQISADLSPTNEQSVDIVHLIRESANAVNLPTNELVLNDKRVKNELLTGDSALLRVAICNLLDNAKKYRLRGAVTVELSGNAHTLCVQIASYSHPIPDSDQKKIFNRFQRGSNTRKGQAGSGLGLHVTTEIIKRHHGSIAVASSNKHSTVFEILLPYTKEDQ